MLALHLFAGSASGGEMPNAVNMDIYRLIQNKMF